MNVHATIAWLASVCLLLAGCVNPFPGATEVSAAQLMPGMTREQVTQLLATPKGILTERNGIECLAYTDRDTSSVPFVMITARDRVIILKDGRLLEHQLLNTGAAPNVTMTMPGAPTFASVCVQPRLNELHTDNMGTRRT